MRRLKAEREYARMEMLARVFKIFGDPTRLKILGLLNGGEMNVSMMVERLGMNQSTVSQCLRSMRECGIVKSKRVGREVRYRLRDEKMGEMMALGEELLTLMAEEMKKCCLAR